MLDFARRFRFFEDGDWEDLGEGKNVCQFLHDVTILQESNHCWRHLMVGMPAGLFFLSRRAVRRLDTLRLTLTLAQISIPPNSQPFPKNVGRFSFLSDEKKYDLFGLHLLVGQHCVPYEQEQVHCVPYEQVQSPRQCTVLILGN